MPALHTYRVSQTREVEIRSTSPQNALAVAVAYLNDETIASDIGSLVKPSEITDVRIERVH